MKTALVALMFMWGMHSASAIESGYYNFTFYPDGNANSFTLCMTVESQPGNPPIVEQGGVEDTDLPGADPYGQPSGTFTLIKTMALTIYQRAPNFGSTPNYRYFLTGNVFDDDLTKILFARYSIAVSEQPELPPQQLSRDSRHGPGGYSLVSTGTFDTVYGGTLRCPNAKR